MLSAVKIAAKTLGLALCTITLAACGTSVTEVANDDQAPVGNATPAASPAENNPDGVVIPMKAIDDLEHVGNTLAIRTEGKLLIGDIEDKDFREAHSVDLDASCGDVTAAHDAFVSACGEEVKIISPEGNVDTQQLEHPATVAVRTSDGTLITGDDQQSEVWIYRQGEDPTSVGVEKTTDQMIVVDNGDSPDAVVRINREYSLIQDVHWQDDKQGPILRVGSGVGQIAAGTNGVLLASDTVGDQLALYSAEEIIRLHQTIPTPESPWAVAWDKKNQQAWTISTAKNKVVVYSPQTGTLELQREANAVANATSLVVLDNGVAVAGSSSGAGLQIL
ncbi:hypothetical protein CPELA_05495 [Corynebacterium pelargi]|uniref:Prolipoprotein LppL n=1 Tax=Corynebacterium pelargi TaxID=1471400 RepID=A0A410W8T7_9CORY|nr:hypothetical protein CPELA_05495 [Corynebacterium pelargi]